MFNKIWIGSLFLLISSPLLASEYSFAVVPQYTVSKTYASWQPLMEALQRATGHQFKLKVYDSFEAFETAYLNGEGDFVYFNPYHQVKGRQAQGYIPLVRDGKRSLTGIIVVRKDSPYRSVQQLQGKELAFPAPNALAASLYMRALLAEQEQLVITPAYVHSHSNVYHQVVAGRYQAGGGVLRTLRESPAPVQEALRVLYTTPPIPPHPIAAHPRVDLQSRQAVVDALLGLSSRAAGQELLRNVQIESPIVADYQRDYRALESLGLDAYYQDHE